MQQIKELNYDLQSYESVKATLPNYIHVNAKKEHEILSLSPLIHDVCTRENISIIIDVGSGVVSLIFALLNSLITKNKHIVGLPISVFTRKIQV